ncbi:Hypothetical predicted protein [Cloeon dipterum]|uniref:Folded gastrulation N-terminal domain-containing protein n=1 Tax=Cloeon dipterum TaxID=197152 RepID=A0A8S1BZD2_9INSE|nr:Hypothetical predicted protein [Cloeon dipterum]
MHLSGWLVCFACTALVAVDATPIVEPAAPSDAPTVSSRLQDEGFWKAWVLFEDPVVQRLEETGRRKGQIMPKSIFIAPVVNNLPKCADGYQADALGRCNKKVVVNNEAQLSFLFHKLNLGMSKIKKEPTTTEGPFHIDIPLGALTDVQATPPVTATAPMSTLTTTEAPPTTVESTEVAEVMVVAAQVELEDDTKSTSLPAAIVTLWHINDTAEATTTLLPEDTQTETVAPTELTTVPADLEETSTPPPDVETPTTMLSENGEDGTTPVTTPSPFNEEEIVETTTPKTPFRRPPVPDPVRIVSQPPEPERGAVTYAEEDETPLFEGPTSPVILDRPYPIVFEQTSTQGELLADLSVENSNPNAQWGQPVKNVRPTMPSTPDRIVFPGELSRNAKVPSTTPWAWGSWRNTTPKPLLLNFYSQVPPLSHTPSGTRTHLTQQSSIFPAPGRRTPLFYQELSGSDVANVLNRPWHFRNRYRY